MTIAASSQASSIAVPAAVPAVTPAPRWLRSRHDRSRCSTMGSAGCMAARKAARPAQLAQRKRTYAETAEPPPPVAWPRPLPRALARPVLPPGFPQPEARAMAVAAAAATVAAASAATTTGWLSRAADFSGVIKTPTGAALAAAAPP